MTIHIVKVVTEDQYRKSLAIRTEVFVVEQKVPVELEVDQYEKICEHFLCMNDSEPVATGRLRRKESLVKFERIATLKHHRGNNYGVALMLAMQVDAGQNYPSLLPYLHAQTSAIGFYEKLGWTKIGGAFFEADIEHYAMALLPENGINPELRNALVSMKDLSKSLRDFLQAGV